MKPYLRTSQWTEEWNDFKVRQKKKHEKMLIQIKKITTNVYYGGVLSIMIIPTENGISDLGPIPGQGYLCFTLNKCPQERQKSISSFPSSG